MRSALVQKYQRYDNEVRSLLDRFARYPDEQLNRKPADGGWSAIQTLHHLLLSEELSLAYVRKKLSFNPTLEKPGPDMYWRSFLLWAYLASPLKFKAPTAVGDTNLPAQATLVDTRARWDQIRQAWATYFQEMPEELLDKQVYRQPFAGRLGWLQTVAFFQGHFRRHRKQALRAAGV